MRCRRPLVARLRSPHLGADRFRRSIIRNGLARMRAMARYMGMVGRSPRSTIAMTMLYGHGDGLDGDGARGADGRDAPVVAVAPDAEVDDARRGEQQEAAQRDLVEVEDLPGDDDRHEPERHAEQHRDERPLRRRRARVGEAAPDEDGVDAERERRSRARGARRVSRRHLILRRAGSGGRRTGGGMQTFVRLVHGRVFVPGALRAA